MSNTAFNEKQEFCARCGKPMGAQDKLCRSCGQWRGARVSWRLRTVLLIAAAIALLGVMAAVISKNPDGTGSNNNSEADSDNAQAAQLGKSLPVSRSEILGWYNPRPKELGIFKTRAGTLVYTYGLEHATLELEEKIDRPHLVRASLKFNIPEIRAGTDTFLVVWLDCAVFAKNIAGVNTYNDRQTLERLGFDHTYDPGPDEIVNNGVRVRRITKGGVLFFELTPE